MLRSLAVMVALAMMVVAARPARADAAGAAEAPAIPCLIFDGGLVVGLPAVLPTGMATGAGAGMANGVGAFFWGARAAVLRATYHTAMADLADTELRMRGMVGARRAIGRGTLGLRLSGGGTAVREAITAHPTRERDVKWKILPAAHLEMTVALDLFGPWGLILAGGPSFHLDDGAIESGFVASMGVTWHP